MELNQNKKEMTGSELLKLSRTALQMSHDYQAAGNQEMALSYHNMAMDYMIHYERVVAHLERIQ